MGHKLGLEWKEFEDGKGSERGLQRQMGLEYTGSLARQTKPKVWDVVWEYWVVRGECLAEKKHIGVCTILEERFQLGAGTGQ